MKIDPTGSLPTSQIRRAGKSGKRSAGSFAVHLNRGAPEADAACAATGVGAVTGLMALQEVEDSTQDRERLVGRGNEILDRLDEIRHGLLLGGIDKQDLVDLAADLRRKRAEVDDPRLIGIIDEIELRAEVEIAKYGG